MNKIGEKLRQARDQAGLSQAEVAEFLKVDQTKISMIERGKRKVNPTTDLPELAKLYKKPISWFFEEQEENLIAKVIKTRYPDLKITPELIEKFEKLINSTIDVHLSMFEEREDSNVRKRSN